jgi:iron complex outermembrane receptor protein/hemoglobin/transferrin/lactoferrin receptor protein
LSGAKAAAPADPQTDSLPVDRAWVDGVYGGGLAWTTLYQPLTLSLNIEQGVVAPNLDDLTARQLTGQGFQIENPNLNAERSLTYELGARLNLERHGLDVEAWLFAMELTEGIERRDGVCPESDLACKASRTARPFTLINLSEPAWVVGAEQRLTWRLPLQLSLKQHLSYARGEGPSPLAQEPGLTRPLSRVPPLNGAVSLRWGDEGAYLGAEARWALAATRLSFGDELDSRIPFGGTPGYVVYRGLFGWRSPQRGLELLGALENLTNVAYRVHGSSVNGAARSVSLSLRYTPL